MRIFNSTFVGLLLLLLSATMAVATDFPEATVIGVSDGDTISVLLNQKVTTIRLACIDAPEMSQETGYQSRNYLYERLRPGTKVLIEKFSLDKYQRTIAKVHTSRQYRNQSVNLEMVATGNAVIYTDYFSPCRSERFSYEDAQDYAKNNRLGFWSQENPVMPWDYRSKRLPPVNVNASTNAGTILEGYPNCVRWDCDCKDFTSRENAQKVFDAFPGDPYRLDGDRDGKACDSYIYQQTSQNLIYR